MKIAKGDSFTCKHGIKRTQMFALLTRIIDNGFIYYPSRILLTEKKHDPEAKGGVGYEKFSEIAKPI